MTCKARPSFSGRQARSWTAGVGTPNCGRSRAGGELASHLRCFDDDSDADLTVLELC